MRTRYLVPIVLAILLVLVQIQLWTGRGSVPDVAQMQHKLDEQKAANAKAQTTNTRLESEVNDLKEGNEMVEERARQELGMVRPNEILVQIAK